MNGRLQLSMESIYICLKIKSVLEINYSLNCKSTFMYDRDFGVHFDHHLIVCIVAGVKRAKVVNARKDTCSREVLRHEEFKDCVQLNRIRDHFICKFLMLNTRLFNVLTFISCQLL